MAAHTHDGVDWEGRVAQLRRADEVDGSALREVADRLIARTPPGSTVADVGCGAGGMSVALAEAMVRHGGGTLVLVDATPALLDVALDTVTRAITTAGATPAVTPPDSAPAAPGAFPDSDPAPTSPAAAGSAGATGGGVRVGQADGAGTGGVVVGVAGVVAGVTDGLERVVPRARLVWASRVVHHLPDQQAGLAALAGLLTPGGCLAVAEGGLAMRCLPWDVGVGEPGLADRLAARRDAWFAGMRSSMPGSTRMPHGWNRALREAGLVGMTSFSYLVDRPAPLSATARDSVVDWLTWMATTTDVLESPDGDAVRRLLDPADAAYVGDRDDTFVLKAATVHLAWSR